MSLGVIVFPGSGSAVELYDALQLVAPGQVEFIDSQATDLEKYRALFLPGGASFGDYLRPGAIAAKEPVIEALKAANEKETPIFAVGNGCQILAEAGLLPGGYIENDSLAYETNPREVKFLPSNAWFDIESDTTVLLPRANRYGTYTVDANTYQQLLENQQILAQYNDCDQESPASVAALTNNDGNIVAMMSRPERAVEDLTGSTAGRFIFDAIRQAIEQ